MRSVGILLAFLLLPGGASGECVYDRTFFAGSGSSVPPDPTLYLLVGKGMAFVMGGRAEVVGDVDDEAGVIVAAVDGRGRPVPTRVEVVQTDHLLTVYRVELGAKSGEVRVAALGRIPPQRVVAAGRYRIDEGAASAGTRGPVEILSVGQEASRFSCYPSQNLTPSIKAHVYRVVWASSEANFRAGRRASAIVPGGAGPVRVSEDRCHGTPIAWGDEPTWVGLEVLRADGGTEAAGDPVPLHVPTPTCGAHYPLGYADLFCTPSEYGQVPWCANRVRR